MTFPKSMLLVVTVLAFLVTPKSASAQLGGLFSGPSVEMIETQDLQAKLTKQETEREQAEKNGGPVPKFDFVLVDVRSDAEINVSLIPGAITKSQYEQNPALYKEKTVIPYCLSGGRSAQYAKQLQNKGVSVINYKGSILAWVKAGLPLVTKEGNPTNRVHLDSDRYKVPSKYVAATR